MIANWIIILITLGMAATSLSQDSHGSSTSGSSASGSSSSSGSSPILYVTNMTNVTSELNWEVGEGAHLPPHYDLVLPPVGRQGKLYAAVQSVDEWLHNLNPNNITHTYTVKHPAYSTPYYSVEFLREPYSRGQVFHSTSMCFSFTLKRI